MTVTSTKLKKCADTTTLTMTLTDHTSTTRRSFKVSPPPIILSLSGVLTTTVPADCASSTYYPNGTGLGNNTIPIDYPYFPQTGVECCVVCFGQEYCVSSTIIYVDDANTIVTECDLLIHVNGTEAGTPGIRPLRIQDYGFGSP